MRGREREKRGNEEVTKRGAGYHSQTTSAKGRACLIPDNSTKLCKCVTVTKVVGVRDFQIFTSYVKGPQQE